MKKYWMIIMALALVIALVVGCAPKEPQPSDTVPGPQPTESQTEEPPTGLDAAEITVQVEKEWMAYYEAAAKRITDANSDVTINLQEIG
ncbi:MAG: sugar ABC transporter substrate-binding protein, partial [Clostridiaceae bacterium]|nr:sugar ABC transporter substrate-binding protein [Clostridiaceae bacterium]